MKQLALCGPLCLNQRNSFLSSKRDRTLDGELFVGRGKFSSTVSVVRTSGSPHWKTVTYMVRQKWQAVLMLCLRWKLFDCYHFSLAAACVSDSPPAFRHSVHVHRRV